MRRGVDQRKTILARVVDIGEHNFKSDEDIAPPFWFQAALVVKIDGVDSFSAGKRDRAAVLREFYLFKDRLFVLLDHVFFSEPPAETTCAAHFRSQDILPHSPG